MTRYLIATTGRTGSTALCDALSNHPQAWCGYELFRPTHGWADRVAREGPGPFLDRCCWSKAGGDVRAAGFKCLGNHPHQEHLVAQPDLRVIVLRRRNLLALVASALLAKAGYGYHGRRRGHEKLDAPASTVINTMRRVERRSGEIERQHREAGQSVLAVDYEDLFFAGGVAWEALQAFLGLDPHPMEAERVKAELRPLSEVFVQWNDIAEALAGTRWAWMAEPEHQQPTHA